ASWRRRGIGCASRAGGVSSRTRSWRGSFRTAPPRYGPPSIDVAERAETFELLLVDVARRARLSGPVVHVPLQLPQEPKADPRLLAVLGQVDRFPRVTLQVVQLQQGSARPRDLDQLVAAVEGRRPAARGPRDVVAPVLRVNELEIALGEHGRPPRSGDEPSAAPRAPRRPGDQEGPSVHPLHAA